MTQAWKALVQRVSRNENDIASIYDLLSDLQQKADGHTTTLAEHSAILNEHSTTLASHGAKLDEILELLRAS